MLKDEILLREDIVISNFDCIDDAVNTVYKHWINQGFVLVNYIYWSNYTTISNDKTYSKSLRKSDYILPDGIGMQLYVKAILGIKINNLNGTDANPVFLKYFSDKKIDIAIYGASIESLNICVEKLKQQNINIYYFQDGYSDLDINKLNNSSVLLVGLGSPKQENWVMNNYNVLKEKKLIVITVGGFIDFTSEKFTRAPKIFRKLYLEWLWRAPHQNIIKNLRNLYILYIPIIDRKSIRMKNKNLIK